MSPLVASNKVWRKLSWYHRMSIESMVDGSKFGRCAASEGATVPRPLRMIVRLDERQVTAQDHRMRRSGNFNAVAVLSLGRRKGSSKGLHLKSSVERAHSRRSRIERLVGGKRARRRANGITHEDESCLAGSMEDIVEGWIHHFLR
jgi:hypothetical protein